MQFHEYLGRKNTFDRMAGGAERRQDSQRVHHVEEGEGRGLVGRNQS